MKPKWVCHLRAFVLLWVFIGIPSNTKKTEDSSENGELHQHPLPEFLYEGTSKAEEVLPDSNRAAPTEETLPNVPITETSTSNVMYPMEELTGALNEDNTEKQLQLEIEDEIKFVSGEPENAAVVETPPTEEASTWNGSTIDRDTFSSQNVTLSDPVSESLVETEALALNNVTLVESPAVSASVEAAKPAVNESAASQNEASDEIPSFSEWTQKVLAEAEKTGGANGNASFTSRSKSASSSKLRQKNYASPDCGAKLLSANPEAQHVSAVLDPARDEYLLSICSSKTWFVVELCEAIQAKRVEIANFELFSSLPKDFKVFISDRYPTREWALVGEFTATDERTIQSFILQHELFGKFVKVELFSHYGERYYCPISLFRVYGTSEYEVLNIEDEPRSHDDATEEEMLEDIKVPDSHETGNLFDSATKAVMDMVKKATGVFAKTGPNTKNNTETNETRIDLSNCRSPKQVALAVVSDGVNSTLSCSWKKLGELSTLPWLQASLAGLCVNHAINTTVYSKELELAELVWGTAVLSAVCHWAQIADISYEVPTLVPCPSTKTPTNVTKESSGGNLESAEDLLASPPPTSELDNMEMWFPEAVDAPGAIDIPPTEMAAKLENGHNNNGTNGSDFKNSVPVSQVNGQGSSQQKESVFVRLSNRIKALERNMSLSSQYLEELSRRYRRQVDDMQKTMNRTLQTLNETLQQISTKEQQQQLEIRALHSEIADLKESLRAVLEENLNMRVQMVEYHIFLIIVELILVAALFVFCARRHFQRWLDRPPYLLQTPQRPGTASGPPFSLEGQSKIQELDVSLTEGLRLQIPEKQQISPAPSCADSTSSGCDSAFSYKVSGSTRSRDPSPVIYTEGAILKGKSKKQKKKRNRALVTCAAATNLPANQIRLKSDNWQWHSRAKTLASALIKENVEPPGMRSSF